MSSNIPTHNTMIFETYTTVPFPQEEDDLDLEGDTLVEQENEDKNENEINDPAPVDAEGLYPLSRCPPRTHTPSPPPPCSNCTHLATQLRDVRNVATHLLHGVQDTFQFLQNLDDNLDNVPSLAQHIPHRSIAQLVQQNTLLTDDVQQLEEQNTLLGVEISRLDEQIEALARKCEGLGEEVGKAESKIQIYKDLNQELAQSHTLMKIERNKAREMVGRERDARAEGEDMLLGEIGRLGDGGVGREVSKWKVLGLMGLVIWGGWDVWRVLVEL
ncbi:hypothetical protein CC86DRAFT_440065 [Ophiobolus disseminans]|uniref:Uncharacterized protein n=1 Tax=Ophiobolus disseminans TaxID=1469910 RepID=A0A6A7A4A8_9PLEO|nr:hypothetical protein CC86DRAFT_440065 [Ophiobolus disseminans]